MPHWKTHTFQHLQYCSSRQYHKLTPLWEVINDAVDSFGPIYRWHRISFNYPLVDVHSTETRSKEQRDTRRRCVMLCIIWDKSCLKFLDALGDGNIRIKYISQNHIVHVTWFINNAPYFIDSESTMFPSLELIQQEGWTFGTSVPCVLLGIPQMRLWER